MEEHSSGRSSRMTKHVARLGGKMLISYNVKDRFCITQYYLVLQRERSAKRNRNNSMHSGSVPQSKDPALSTPMRRRPFLDVGDFGGAMEYSSFSSITLLTLLNRFTYWLSLVPSTPVQVWESQAARRSSDMFFWRLKWCLVLFSGPDDDDWLTSLYLQAIVSLSSEPLSGSLVGSLGAIR